jgi:hypothetical protein
MAKYDAGFFAGPDDDVGITLDDFRLALSVWSFMQDEPPTVRAASNAFNVEATIIRQAVAAHPWMFICGDGDDNADTIEHDGD